MEKNTSNSSLKFENFSFCYPNREKNALQNVSFSLKQGEFAVLCGLSGCGKTTLLRQCKPVLAAYGEKRGKIFLNDIEIDNVSSFDAASKIGFVQQNSDNQIVTDKVWHELAFGLESLGYNQQTIRLRVAEMASFFGIQDWFYRSVSELSGGQKQLLALACVMVMQPSLLILDEPTAQLDPIAASEFLFAVEKVNRELGVTVLMAEHRFEEVFSMCSKVLIMDNGKMIFDGNPLNAGEFLKNKKHKMFVAMPTPIRIWSAVENNFPCPITVKDGREWISNMNVRKTVQFSDIENKNLNVAAELNDVWFKYDRNAPDIIKGLDFSAHFGEITAILGGNGTGKTTALSLISGLNKAYRGKVKIKGIPIEKIPKNELYNNLIGVLPQNSQTLFTENTVEKDLNECLKNADLTKNEKRDRLEKIISLCRLDSLLDHHPYDLSGGEQQRAAFAKILLLEPEIILLDEPTKALDAEFKQAFAEILQKLAATGKAIIMVSHDVDFCAEYVNKCALFFDGNIVTKGTPHEFFSGNSFYTSSANRMSRHVLPQAVTVDDVITALDGENITFNNENENGKNFFDDMQREFIAADNVYSKKICEKRFSFLTKKKTIPPKNIFAVAMIFLLIPATVLMGVFVFGDRRYYFTSLLVIIESMIPFAFIFESRKPQAREIVLLAVLVAIAVAGRAAFFMIPQFKPVIAIIIIAGVSFGGEAGFLVGALSGFVSNMMFGQGPWTPWQMFAFGIIGFLAGTFFKNGLPKHEKITLCIFGAFSAFFIYGGILNISTVLTYQSYPNLEMFAASCIQALPFDIVHAAATVFFLAVISKQMLEKLNRIKIKYGIMPSN